MAVHSIKIKGKRAGSITLRDSGKSIVLTNGERDLSTDDLALIKASKVGAAMLKSGDLVIREFVDEKRAAKDEAAKLKAELVETKKALNAAEAEAKAAKDEAAKLKAENEKLTKALDEATKPKA